MRYTIDPAQTKPAYMQLYILLREDIVRGLYPRGSKLPSKRLVAAETGVSLVTVEHAYAILCDEGYLEARERSGYFVIYGESRLLPVAEATLPPPPAGSVDDEAFPFTVLARTMRRVIAEYGSRLLAPSPHTGCRELRGALAAYLARSRNLTVQPEQIIIGSGAEYLYGLIVQLLGRERLYALESPSYDAIRLAYLAQGAECELLTLGPEGIRSRELARTRATVLHVTPYRSFPSRVTASATKRREYLRWAEERNGYLVEDDFESEFTVSTKTEDTLFTPQGRVLYLNTFSKTIAPSIRVGYMVLPETLAREFREKLGFYCCTVPLYEQLVLAELLAGGDFERHINRVRRARRREMKG